ncbi:BLUF domain-containing protein (plasmid) [Paracoccus liaowanqingii]|uniref:BLUF domain-containing protein n=1 Tax=Paracoccus liaowanqingii TaxID=2560053 RepID=A0A4Y5SQQ4_9RHOB|nr:BLUF domain-containing protein [Paracoccus liaowanqingii]QDA35679.1 BLUF domain-containing protein [Paracoccus liaowanqingii]
MILNRLIYSSYHGGIEIESIGKILDVSRANNRREDITGSLIVDSEDFVQLLEGSQTAIANCFMRITLDNRHRNLKILLSERLDIRLFKSWSMHLLHMSRIKEEAMSAYGLDGIYNFANLPADDVIRIFKRISAGNAERIVSAENCEVPKSLLM